MSIQLPLNIQLRDDATLESFYPGDNQEVLQAVHDLSEGIGEIFVYVWGSKGAGCSHLLQATLNRATELGVPAVYIPLHEKDSFDISIFQGLEELSLVCLDDLQSIAGDAVWEEAFFHLFNRIRENKRRLLVAANTPPMNLNLKLADLKSRLSWGVVYHLHELNDDQKLAALQLRASHRGLELSDQVGHFLLNRCSRNMSELFELLEILDKASLTEQHRLTIPFVKHILKI